MATLLPEGVPVPIHSPHPLQKSDSIVSIIGVEEDAAPNSHEQPKGGVVYREDQGVFYPPESSGSTPQQHARWRASEFEGTVEADINAEAHDSSSTAGGSSGSDSDVAGRGRPSRSNWSKEDDAALVAFVEKNGLGQWAKAGRALGRTGKQCRNRWSNTLEPGLKDVEWTNHEERRLVQFHRQFGCKWATLSRHMPGRSANSIKNHWYNTIKCKEQRTSKRERSRVLRDYVVNLGIAVDGGHVAQSEDSHVASTPPFRQLAKSQSFDSRNQRPLRPPAKALEPSRLCPILPRLNHPGANSPLIYPAQVAVPITGGMFLQTSEEPPGKRQNLEGRNWGEKQLEGNLEGGQVSLGRQGGELGWIKRWAANHPDETAPEVKLRQGSVAVPLRTSSFDVSDDEIFQLLGLSKADDSAPSVGSAQAAQGSGFGPLRPVGCPPAPFSVPSSYGSTPADLARGRTGTKRNQLELLGSQNQPVRSPGLLGSFMGHRPVANLLRDNSLPRAPSHCPRAASQSVNRVQTQEPGLKKEEVLLEKEGPYEMLTRSISDGKITLQGNPVISKSGSSGNADDENLNLIALVSSHVRSLLDEQAEYLRQTGESSTGLKESSTGLGLKHVTHLRDQNLQIRSAVSFLSTLAPGIPDPSSDASFDGLSGRLTTNRLPGAEEETTLSSVMSSVMQTDGPGEFEPGTLTPLQALNSFEPATLRPVKPALSDLDQGPLGMLPLGEAPVTATGAQFRFYSQPTWAKMDGPGNTTGGEVSLLPGELERLLSQGLEIPAVSEKVPLQYGPVTPVPEWERPLAHSTIDWPNENGRKSTDEFAVDGGISLEALLEVPSADDSFLAEAFPGLGNN